MPQAIPADMKPTDTSIKNAPIDVIIINDPMSILALVARVSRLRTFFTGVPCFPNDYVWFNTSRKNAEQ
jgi:hypothetical protein